MFIFLIECEIFVCILLICVDGGLNLEVLGWLCILLYDIFGILDWCLWGCNKCWEYWNVMSLVYFVLFIVFSVDYMFFYEIWVFDWVMGESVGLIVILFGSCSVEFLVLFGEGLVCVCIWCLMIDVDELFDGICLCGCVFGVFFDIMVVCFCDYDLFGVVVFWFWEEGDLMCFQYIVKDVVCFVIGYLSVNGVVYDLFVGSWVVFDYGCGCWLYCVYWNWVVGSGIVEGCVIGLQFGLKWIDGFGMIENVFVVDGWFFKFGEDYVWDYDFEWFMQLWYIYGEIVDLMFMFFYDKYLQINVLVIVSRMDQLFGVWLGWVCDVEGVCVCVDGIEGFVEDVFNCW